MRSFSKETDSQSPLAAEPWLTTLVEAIKKEDHAVAEREYQTTRRAELIAQNGPVFWRKFTDVLEALFRQMEELFGNHVTKGKISFTRSPYGGGITINKSAYPFVSFSATPNFSETTAHFTYTVVNPEIPQNIGVPGRFLPCRFGVESDQVVMSLDGTMFTTPEAAAKFIMEKLFTIASAAPVVIHEPAAVSTEPKPLADYAWPHFRSKPAFPVLDDVPAAETDAPATESEPPVVVAAEQIPDAPPAVESVAPATDPEPAAVSSPGLLPGLLAGSQPGSLLPPPLPFSVVRTPAPVSTGRAPFSKLFASASRLLGGGSTASSRSLMTALTALPAAAVPVPISEIVEPVAVAESAVVENVSEPVAAQLAPAVLEPIAEATLPLETAEATLPLETAEATLPLDEGALEQAQESIACAECQESPSEETLETPEVTESSDTVSSLESQPSVNLVAISASRVPRRRVRPQVVRTRFRYQDPRRHLPVQKIATPLVVRPEVRPAEARHAAAGF